MVTCVYQIDKLILRDVDLHVMIALYPVIKFLVSVDKDTVSVSEVADRLQDKSTTYSFRPHITAKTTDNEGLWPTFIREPVEVVTDTHFLERADSFILGRRYDRPDEVEAGVLDFTHSRLGLSRGALLSFASPDFIRLAAPETFLRALRERKFHMVIFALETISGSLGEDGKLYFLFPCSTLYASQFAQVSEWIVSLLDRLGIRTASSKE